MSITGTARSENIKAANSKIAVMLRKREEDDAILTIGKRKTRDVAKDEPKNGRSRKGKTAWDTPADFSFPTPLVDRPRTADGNQSFHFSVTTISKTVAPTDGGKPVAGLSTNSHQTTLDHSKYIERDGAAEHSNGAEHSGYIERPGAVESIDPSALLAEAVERDVALMSGEDLSPDEAAFVGPLDEIREGIPSIFSNISDDPFEREEYWKAVYRSERKPRAHSLILDPESSPKFWEGLDENSPLNPDFKAHLLQVKEAYRQYNEHSLNEQKPKPFVAQPFAVSADRAGTLLLQAMKLSGFDQSQPPTVFKSDRGGRTQIRFVAELPHELTPEDRALIVQNFTDHLGSFSTKPDGSKTGLMYTAVVHAPDIHNDNRNYHLHIVAHDRPAKFVPALGQWDFEIEEHFVIDHHHRVRHPFRQNKIGEVSQGQSKTGKPGSGVDFIPTLRKEFARITNAVLEARGIDKRYDPRKYTEMEIERDPTEHLGTKAAALEAAGVATPVGKINAIKIWRDAERAIERNAAAADKIFKKRQQQLADIAAAAMSASVSFNAQVQLRRLMAERQTLIDGLAEDRRLVETFDNLEAKAKSRAAKTQRTCLAYLTDISSGQASSFTKSLRPKIEARFKQAQAHINKIDLALADDRAGVADMSQSIVAREARVFAIDQAVEPIIAVLEGRAVSATQQGINARQAIAQAYDPDGFTAGSYSAANPRPRQDEIATVSPKTGKPGAGPLSPTSATTTPVNQPAAKEPRHERIPDYDLLRRVRRVLLAACERSFGDDPPGIAPQPITSMRKLSDFRMVHDNGGPQMLLSYPSWVGLGRQDGTSDDVRRPGTGGGSAVGETGPVEPKIADLKPVSSEGLPIVPPSLPPRPKLVTPTAPAGLDPLRPPPVQNAAQPVGQPLIVDLDADAQPQLPNTKVINDNTAVAKPLPSADPKIDNRLRVEPATLFPLKEQLPPIKPGSPKHTYEEWEKLLSLIAEKRIHIVELPNKQGGKTYSVPSLDDAQNEILGTERFSNRTNNRLGSIYENQQLEIDRLVRWISTKGQERNVLIIADEKVNFRNAPASISTLMANWNKAEPVISALRSEMERRIITDAINEHTSLPMPNVPGLEELTPSERQAKAEYNYPPPRLVRTSEVKAFCEELRSAAPSIRELEYLVMQIHANPAARADVMRYTAALAEEYEYRTNPEDKKEAYLDAQIANLLIRKRGTGR